MACVTSVQFGFLPPASTSLFCKALEKTLRGISFRNAGNKGRGNMRLVISRKAKRLLKAAQTKITQPRPREVTRVAWLESPQVKLSFPARQPPPVALFLRDIAKMLANFRWKQ